MPALVSHALDRFATRVDLDRCQHQGSRGLRSIDVTTSSTDFMLPYNFLVELMGDRATLRQDLLQWLDTPLDLEALAAANPFPDVRLEATTDARGRAAIRIACTMPDSGDVAHHPFQPEIDELVACVIEDRETSMNVFDAYMMGVCLAADLSAEQGGQPVALPLISE